MPHAGLALFLALAVAAINLGELIWFRQVYLPRQMIVPILLWAVLPAPVVAWLASRFIKSAWGAGVLCGGLGLALALGVIASVGVHAIGRHEPLNALIVIAIPAYQNVLLLVSFLVAWIVDRRVRASSRSE